MFPLKGWNSWGWRHSATGHVKSSGAAILDIGPRRVEMRVVGYDLARLDRGAKQNALGRTALVGGNDVLEPGDLLDGRLEPVERARPGIRFVPAHHAGPLVGRHRSGAGVGQQVDQHVLGLEQEEVVSGCDQRGLTFGARAADRLDGLDAERLDDGLEGHGVTPMGRL